LAGAGQAAAPLFRHFKDQMAAILYFLQLPLLAAGAAACKMLALLAVPAVVVVHMLMREATEQLIKVLLAALVRPMLMVLKIRVAAAALAARAEQEQTVLMYRVQEGQVVRIV
jgi:hypothetical protein